MPHIPSVVGVFWIGFGFAKSSVNLYASCTLITVIVMMMMMMIIIIIIIMYINRYNSKRELYSRKQSRIF